MDNDDLVGIIEGILFGAGDPVSLKDLSCALEKSALEVGFALEVLKLDYNSKARGIRLIEVNNTYQLSTKPEYYGYIREITKHKQKNGLSRAALETMAIVAYRQPVTRLLIDELRGVSSSSAIQRLLDKGLLCESGRLEAPGRPILYKTTSEFLKAIGFKNLKEMPEYEVFSHGKQEKFDLTDAIAGDQKTIEEPINMISSILEQAILDKNEEEKD